MRYVDLAHTDAAAIEQFGSVGVEIVPLVVAEAGATAVDIARIEAGGLLGRHAAPVPQLFVVVTGSGWVSGTDDLRRSVAVGQGAVWEAGEEHAAGTDNGMTAVIVEAAEPSGRGLLRATSSRERLR